MKFSRARRIRQSLWGLLLLMFFNPALGNAEELRPIERVDGALNQWKAFQTTMNDHGILMETTNTVDVLSNVSGGINQKTSVVGDLDLLLTIDTEKFISGWQGGTLFVYGLGLYGDDPSKHVGDIQAVSNIAAPNTWKLFEAWYQQNLFEHFSLLAGLYDVTSEFDVMMSSSELFVNSSFGTGAELAASGQTGPSTFPATSLGIRGQAIVTDSLMVRTVLTDGVPGDPNNTHGTHIRLSKDDGLFGAMEFAYYKFRDGDTVGGKPRRLTFRRVGRSAPIEYEAKAAIGFWGYTTTLNHLSKIESSGDPSKQHGTYGMYGLAEYDVYHEKGDNDQELTLFVRAGMADPRVNRFSQYYGGGLVYTGLFPGRNFDETGIGAAAAVNGKHYKRSQGQAGQSVNNAEITLEVTHSIYVNPNIFIQPDVQYVINPDTVPGRKNALVLGVRLEFNFNWFSPSRIS